MALIRGWEVFTRNGGSQEWGGGGSFIMGDGTLLKSLYTVGRGVLIPLFYEDPILPTPFFSNYVNKQNNHIQQTFRER